LFEARERLADRDYEGRQIRRDTVVANIGRRRFARRVLSGFSLPRSRELSEHVPANLIQRWMGHASLTTTAIYIDAVGLEERQFASR
jgi:integrase